MSLILEALRKSEAERQRGRAPGLFVEQVATRPKDRTKVPAWAWLLGALLLATLAAFAWREATRQAPGQVSLPDPELSAALEPPPTVDTASAAVQSTVPDPVAATERSSPAEPATATTAAPIDIASAAPAPAAAPPPEPVATIQPVATPQDATPTPLPAPPVHSLPTLASLDAATRAQLPPLKLSMHVFADAPAQRFVILDGQRLGEGASPAAGIVLEEIRREGLVLSVNGQRLLLARP